MGAPGQPSATGAQTRRARDGSRKKPDASRTYSQKTRTSAWAPPHSASSGSRSPIHAHDTMDRTCTKSARDAHAPSDSLCANGDEQTACGDARGDRGRLPAPTRCRCKRRILVEAAIHQAARLGPPLPSRKKELKRTFRPPPSNLVAPPLFCKCLGSPQSVDNTRAASNKAEQR
jgi:hypothetical protein